MSQSSSTTFQLLFPFLQGLSLIYSNNFGILVSYWVALVIRELIHECLCQVNHFVYQGGDLSNILHQLDEFDFGFVGLRVDAPDPLAEEGENTPNCSENYEEPPEVIRRSSKKKSDRRFLQNMFNSMGNRRKGAPQRSPLA